MKDRFIDMNSKSKLFSLCFIFCAFLFFPTSVAQLSSQLSTQLNKRFEAIPLPDTAEFYGQNEAFADIVETAFCENAVQNNMRLGSEGWLYNLKDDLDFGLSQAKPQDGALPKTDLVLWLKEYKTALETVGMTPIMMLVPQRGLVSEQYLDKELQNYLLEIDSKDQYEAMLKAYLEAGFDYVPDLLKLTKEAAAKGGYHAFYPIDHHITTHTAHAWAKEIAQIVMSQKEYSDFDKTEYKISLLDKVFEVIGWHQQMEVQWACESNMEGNLFNPYYQLEEKTDNSADALFKENKALIATVGSSHLGSSENRAGTSDYITPGSGLAEFTAYLTQLPVLNHPMFSLANASIEHYLRNDFYADEHPPYLVQLIEAHHNPYPVYHYRSMAALTYGECQNPVWQDNLLFDDYFELAVPEGVMQDDSLEYYLWLELDLPVLEHRKWSITLDYDDGSETIPFDTDDRFLPFPSTFGIQLAPNHKALKNILVEPDPEWWRGDIIKTSLCSIKKVQEDYEKLNR